MNRETLSALRDRLVGRGGLCRPGSRPGVSRAARAGVVVALLAAAVFVVAAPQRAEGQTAPQPIVGWYRSIQTYNAGSSSDPVPSGYTNCDSGDYGVGGGAQLLGDSLAIEQQLSFGRVSAGSAWAQEITPISGNWTLTVYKVCANELPPGAQGVVSPWTTESSASPKSASVSCGTGKVVLNWGAELVHDVYEPDPLAAGITEVRPTSTGSGVYAVAKEWPGGYSGTWRLRTWAQCAYPPAGYEVRHTQATGRTATAQCSAGKHVLGAGAATAYFPITRAVPRVSPDGAIAEAPRNSTTADTITAWATCANTAATSTSTTTTTTVACPPDLTCDLP